MNAPTPLVTLDERYAQLALATSRLLAVLQDPNISLAAVNGGSVDNAADAIDNVEKLLSDINTVGPTPALLRTEHANLQRLASWLLDPNNADHSTPHARAIARIAMGFPQ